MLYKNFRWGLTGEPQEMVVENGRVVRRSPLPQNGSFLREGVGGGRLRGPQVDGEDDLQGQYLLPGFIDSHCHILPTGLDLQKLYLGDLYTKDQILDAVRDRNRESGNGEWLMAVHYDQTKFPDSKHLSKEDLDQISSTRPILLRHVNGHASVANSVALAKAGVESKTPDPKGGTYVRDGAGNLTGVLLETAHEYVTNAAPSPTREQMVQAILAASEKMHALGITCASDMMTGRYNLALELEAYRLASEQGSKVRYRLYLQWATVFGARGIDPSKLRELSDAMNPDTCRVGGIKIFADGAIGSATAAIYGRFLTTERLGDTMAPQEDGQLIYSPERLKDMVRTAHEAGYSVSIHSIGDRSTDLVMDAYEALDHAEHHRIEHAMILSDAQIERMKRLGIHCTMQPEFLKHFGHSYIKQLGPERASMLKRARSVKDAGIPLSFSSDRPIVGGNPWDGILSASDRHPPFNPVENVTFVEAIEAYTKMGAVANRDDNMGALDPGQLADFQVLPAIPPQGVD